MNNISLFGRMTADNEIKTAGDNKYLKFCLAVDRRTKEKTTDFIDCIAWNKVAELINTYVHKGNQLLINGNLETSSYEKDGEKRKAYVVTVREIDFVSQTKPADETRAPAENSKAEPQPDVASIPDEQLPFSI